jgi:tRNA wybutosine-synthesizing protein 2
MKVSCISLIVPKKYVKTVKTALEKHEKLDRSTKITHYYHATPSAKVKEPMLVPTTIESYSLIALSKQERISSVLADLSLENLSEFISIFNAPRSVGVEQVGAEIGNPFVKAVRKSLLTLSIDFLQSIDATVDSLLSELPTSYSVYPPMLLLPKPTFSGSKWTALFSRADEVLKDQVFGSIASSMNVTHIATNAPIPLLETNQDKELETPTENILRSPINLAPLFGDFGPVVNSPDPTSEDFNNAFWVSTLQNGISQVWAPRYTMFSRGNITEKLRVLNLPSVSTAVEQGRTDGQGSAAVDLYSGIGYFAFSYAKAGVDKIYCWELNPWSVEGFKRGAEKNKWGVRMVDEEHAIDERSWEDDPSKFVVFNMDNKLAAPIIDGLRSARAPIRHVNCGLLPTSKGSWETAVRILDPILDGWVHLHENIATDEIESKSQEILDEIQRLVDDIASQGNEARETPRTAVLQHVEKVKTYAPRVMHCVLDIYICNVIMKR